MVIDPVIALTAVRDEVACPEDDEIIYVTKSRDACCKSTKVVTISYDLRVS